MQRLAVRHRIKQMQNVLSFTWKMSIMSCLKGRTSFFRAFSPLSEEICSHLMSTLHGYIWKVGLMTPLNNILTDERIFLGTSSLFYRESSQNGSLVHLPFNWCHALVIWNFCRMSCLLQQLLTTRWNYINKSQPTNRIRRTLSPQLSILLRHGRCSFYGGKILWGRRISAE